MSETVVSVSCNDVYSFTKPVRDEIVLLAGLGVEGDVHAGVRVKHRGRVRADPTQPNVRQVHLIQAELFGEVAEAGYVVEPGQLGENVTTSGIDLLNLPRGTILRFGRPPTATAGTGAPGGADTATVAGRAEKTVAGAAGGAEKAAAGVAGGANAAVTGGANAAVAGRAEAAVAGGAEAAVAGVLAVAASARMNEPTASAVEAVRAAAARDQAKLVGAGHGDAGQGEPQSAGCGDDGCGGAGDPRAAVVITGLRNPCAQINGFQAGLLKEVVGRDEDGRPAYRAGVMAVVLRSGSVRAGDPVCVELPPAPFALLDRI
jgi:MOSC domain-containing protein YiiM